MECLCFINNESTHNIINEMGIIKQKIILYLLVCVVGNLTTFKNRSNLHCGLVILVLFPHNRFLFHFRDAICISLINCCTSLFAGFAIFCVLGHMAFKLGQTVDKVVTSGMHYISYTLLM